MLELWVDEIWLSIITGPQKYVHNYWTTDDPRTTEMLEIRCEMLEKRCEKCGQMLEKRCEKCDRKCRYFLGNKCLRNRKDVKRCDKI